MRIESPGFAVALVLAGAALAACAGEDGADAAADAAVPARSTMMEASFDPTGDQLAHGERLATVFGCNACHGEDYTGVNFGEMIPIVEGLWASNISRTMPELTDAQLERLLREGVHPDREIYLMPSKQSQFLSAGDMAALIAHLRTIEPAGEPTPLPPPGFEAAVTARLPEDYWRASLDGHPRSYHNAAEEADYFAVNAPPDLGVETAQGRLVAVTVCTSCHGAALDGVGEPAGDIQGALAYDDAQFRTLLRDGVMRNGEQIELPWGIGHAPTVLTDGEMAAVVAYTRRLAGERAAAAE